MPRFSLSGPGGRNSTSEVGRVHPALTCLCLLFPSLAGALWLALSSDPVGPRQAVLWVVALAAASAALTVPLAAGARWRALFLSVLCGLLGAMGGTLVHYAVDYRSRCPDVWARLSGESGTLSPQLLLQKWRGRPPVDLSTLPPIPPEVESRTADLAMEDTFAILEFPPQKLGRDLTWKEDPLRDRIWQWGLHTTPAVPALAASYRATGDLARLERAEAIVLDWIADNQHYLYRPPSPFSWHDHVMALRVRGWLPFWDLWVRSPLASEEKAERILQSIVLHADRLEDHRYYNEGHNHGMEQDFALLAISVALPELKKAAGWRKTAERRIKDQVAEVISPDGIQLEHTPYYHVFTLDILSDLQEFARRVGVTREELDLDPVLKKMARYTANILQPNGTLPLIGDTPREPPIPRTHRTLSRFLDTDPVLRFALTQGREGSPGEDTIFHAKDGYAVLRDSWHRAPDFGKTFYLFFTAAAHEGRVHKQHDDLSFTLFACGQELLTDAGFHSNEYGDPEREYVTGTSAHNTILVDRTGFTGWTARIETTIDGGSDALVQASHGNYPGLVHRRTLYYSRPSTVLVLDQVTPSAAASGGPGKETPERTFEQLWHFPPEVQPRRTDDPAVLIVERREAAGTSPLLRFDQLADGRNGARVLEGSKLPLQGWIATGHRELRAAPVASFEVQGTEALFVTLIRVCEEAARTPSAQEAAPRFSRDGAPGVILVEWNETGGPRRVQIRPGPPAEILR